MPERSPARHILKRSLLGVSSLLFVVGCGGGTVAPDDPVSEEILVTAGPHHLGDNLGAEGVNYQSTFQVTASFDSARVAITFLLPNSFDVSGPEIENAPKIFVNSIELGLTASHFPDDPACVSGLERSASTRAT